MNKEKVIGLAKNIFPEMTTVKEDLYRGELKISGKPAGVYFMDLSGQVPFDKFNDYQENLLADEYYSHPGSLQWNLYLLLLQDIINPETKQEIERNEKYARKYIFTESEFEDFFKLEKTDAVVSSNVVLEWKEALKKVDLQEVYSKAKYTEAIDRFLNNQTKKITSGESGLETSNIIKINFINQISLKNTYREHPKEPRVFKFGKVNLIKGINGVGKTCLLEAIELVACGRTFRNSDKKELDNCIEAIINNSRQTEICTPTDNGKYRLRDSYWFSNNYTKDNFVYSSFNRFNFFSTDAANDFAKSNNEDDVKQALSNLILGSEFNYISERINGFYDRIKPVHNELDREIEAARQTLKNSELLISKLRKPDSLNSLMTIVNDNIQSLNFANKNLNVDNGYVEVEVLINQLKTLTEKVLETRNLIFNCRSDLNNYKRDLASRESAFTIFKTNLEKISQDISSEELQIHSLMAKADLLASVKKYLTDPKLFEIEGLSQRLAEVEDLIRKTQAITKSLGTINYQALSSEENINSLLERTRSDLAITKQNLDEIQADLRKLLAQFSNTDKIITEIKLLGKEYLKLASVATSCPLCQSSYERTELERRISEVLSTNSRENQKQIDSLYQKQQQAKESVDRYTQYLNDVVSIKTAYDNTFGGDSAGMSIAQLIHAISRLKDEEGMYVQRKQELLGFRQTTESLNITEAEFSYLSNKLTTDMGPEYAFVFTNKKLFEDHAAIFFVDIEKLKEGLSKLKESRSKLISDLKLNLGLEKEKTYALSEIDSVLDADKKSIGLFDSYFNQISE